MKRFTRNDGPRRPPDLRSVLLVLAALGLQGLILYLLVTLAFPDWRPAFLGGTAEEITPARVALPAAPVSTPDGGSIEPQAPAPTEAAASRMLFGGPDSAVLGDRVPTAPPPAPSPTTAPASLPGQAPATLADAPSPAARLAAQRYLEWLRQVELDRQSLRIWGERHLPELAASAPGSAERKQALNLAQTEVNGFRQRIVRNKPVVPPSFRIVDQYYTGAVMQEGAQAVELLEAWAQNDPEAARRQPRPALARVDRDLTVANAKLEQTLRQRGEPVTLHLEMGPGASILGTLAELRPQP